MNITNLLSQIGLGDGQGNTSSMRVMLYIIVLAVLIPAVVAALKTGTPVTLTPQQLILIGTAFGGKCVQNTQENQATLPSAPSAPAAPVK